MSVINVGVLHMGLFGDLEVSTEDDVKCLKHYWEALDDGLTVRVLQPVPVSHTARICRVNEGTCNLQTQDLWKYPKKEKPRDASHIVGITITMTDLYRCEPWNFISGQASLTKGVSVLQCSFVRFMCRGRRRVKSKKAFAASLKAETNRQRRELSSCWPSPRNACV
ncbi:archaemetzincin-2 [Rhea pennata]|uniref:archaemetzincin-2 n=1 Tax=Rhea pennata TaxID=8795 RepID=UPI002E273284